MAIAPIFGSQGTIKDLLATLPWPVEFFDRDDLPDFLDSIYVVKASINDEPGALDFSLSVMLVGEASIAIPGLDGVELVIGGALPDLSGVTSSVPEPKVPGEPTPEGFPEDVEPLPNMEGMTFLTAKLVIKPAPALVFPSLTMSLRFSPEILKPADPNQTFVEIATSGSITIDQNFSVRVDGFDAFNLTPALIGSSGIAVSADGVKLDLSRTDSPPEVTAAGFDESFLGVFIGNANVTLPAGMLGSSSQTLVLSNAAIGSGGVSGTASLQHLEPVFQNGTYQGERAGTLFGVPFWLSDLSLSLKANAFVNATVNGELVLPFLDKRTSVRLSFDGNGGVALQVTAIAGDPGSNGVFSVNVVNGIDFDIRSLTIEERNGKALFKMDTKLRIGSIVGDGLTWPIPEINGLAIDSDGNVQIDGGWVDLPKQLTMDLYAAKMELTKIGFGTDDDGIHRWIGFSGGLKIVDGVKAGASVDGLRIHYRTDISELPTVSLEGVGIELDIPNVLTAKGSLSLKQKEMAGGAQVTILPIQMTIGGQFVSGTLDTGEKTFGIFLHAELPAGIPIGATGLGIYGMAGLYAENRKPGKKADEGWYQNPDGSPGWYLRKVPPANLVGVEDLGGKWVGSAGSRGFGAGVTLGTFGDNGFKFNGRLLLVLVFPGPTVLIEGKANLFKKRAELEGADPTFRALAVIEPGKSFLMSLDAHYKYKASGELMDLRGSAEAFFDFASPSNWHVILGFKDDPNRRIRARLFKLYDVSSYFELRPGRLDIGASWAFDKSWSFGRLGVRLAASLEEAATVSWRPNHFTGFLSLQGRAELRAFGRGVGVNASAKISGDVFDPFHLKGDFHVGIDLPWPLPDVGATVTLEWTRAMSQPAPALPLPLQQASAEFGGWQLPEGAPVRPMRWPFTRGGNLLPSYDKGQGDAGHGSAPGSDATAAVFNSAPVVPADAQIGLTFSRPVKDTKQIGNNPHDVPKEMVGDPFQSAASEGYRDAFSLSEVTLEKIGGVGPNEPPGAPLPTGVSAVGWVKVASGGALPDTTSGTTTIYGAWTRAAPADSPPLNPPVGTPRPTDRSVGSDTPVAQTKLMLGAKSPLQYTALSSQTWEDRFSDIYQDYPCTPFDPEEKLVATFTQAIGSTPTPPVAFESPAFQVTRAHGGDITALDPATVGGVDGPINRGLRVDDLVRADPATSANVVVAPPDATEVRIRVATPATLTHPSGEGLFPQVGTPGPLYGGTVTMVSFDGLGNVIPNQVDEPAETRRGLLVHPAVEFTPQVPAQVFDVRIFTDISGEGDPDFRATSAVAQAYDSAGHPAGGFLLTGASPHARIHGTDIARVRVTLVNTDGVPLVVESVYFRAPVVANATAASDPSVTFGPFTEDANGLITVTGTDLGNVHLQAKTGGEFAIVELSVPSRRDVLLRHTIAALQRFAEEDPVFEPDTNYRLRIKTIRTTTSSSANVPASMKGDDNYVETVYFRTAPLPGVGVPSLPAGVDAGRGTGQTAVTGFEDLSFYVSRTVPAVPPPEGGHNSPAKAFYRAYDVNVEFTEQAVHVQRMYKLGHRDLTLRLFDGNNQPLRDATGRFMLGQGRWGKSDNPTVSQAASRWIGIVAGNDCVPTPPASSFEILAGERITVPSEPTLLAPERLFQARLVPMLLRESFEDVRFGQRADGQFQLDRWHTAAGSTWLQDSRPVVDPTTGQTVGRVFFAKVSSALPTSLVYHGPLASLNAVNLPSHPSQWTDFRASVQLRWQDGEVGFEFRRSDAGFMRVTLDRAGFTQRLISFVGASNTTVRENQNVVFPSADSDVVLTVECVGDSVQVFQNLAGEPLGEPIFTYAPVPLAAGTVAVFSNGATAPEFTEVHVHDLRSDPATAHRFDLITSRYTNFHHHLGSADTQVFDAPGTLAAGDVSAALPSAFATPTAVDFSAPAPAGGVPEAEQRAFDALEKPALGSAALRTPDRLEFLDVSTDGSVTGLLVRSPEPIRWERAELFVETSSQAAPSSLAGALALTGVSFAGLTANQETVTVLMRESVDPTGYKLQRRPIPDPINDPNPDWTDHFVFGTETALAEGTQVRVHSGAPEAIAHDVGITLRFAASDPSFAQPRFPAAGVELRLLTPAGEVVHQRTFLPDAAYAIVAANVIRKQDGTAFFVFMPGISGSARLNFAYVRNVIVPLPANRQAGSVEPERIALVVPLG